MWGVGPVTRDKLADQGILTIEQLANTPGHSLERLLGHAVGDKLCLLAWNRDPREIRTHPERDPPARSLPRSTTRRRTGLHTGLASPR